MGAVSAAALAFGLAEEEPFTPISRSSAPSPLSDSSSHRDGTEGVRTPPSASPVQSPAKEAMLSSAMKRKRARQKGLLHPLSMVAPEAGWTRVGSGAVAQEGDPAHGSGEDPTDSREDAGGASSTDGGDPSPPAPSLTLTPLLAALAASGLGPEALISAIIALAEAGSPAAPNSSPAPQRERVASPAVVTTRPTDGGQLNQDAPPFVPRHIVTPPPVLARLVSPVPRAPVSSLSRLPPLGASSLFPSPQEAGGEMPSLVRTGSFARSPVSTVSRSASNPALSSALLQASLATSLWEGEAAEGGSWGLSFASGGAGGEGEEGALHDLDEELGAMLKDMRD